MVKYSAGVHLRASCTARSLQGAAYWPWVHAPPARMFIALPRGQALAEWFDALGPSMWQQGDDIYGFGIKNYPDPR